MTNSSLVIGTRRHGCRSLLIGIVAGCAISVHAGAPNPRGTSSVAGRSGDGRTQTAVVRETTMAEPVSLLFLGASLVTVASRLRRRFAGARQATE